MKRNEITNETSFSFAPALFLLPTECAPTSNTLIMVTNINTSPKILSAFRRLMPVEQSMRRVCV